MAEHNSGVVRPAADYEPSWPQLIGLADLTARQFGTRIARRPKLGASWRAPIAGAHLLAFGIARACHELWAVEDHAVVAGAPVPRRVRYWLLTAAAVVVVIAAVRGVYLVAMVMVNQGAAIATAGGLTVFFVALVVEGVPVYGRRYRVWRRGPRGRNYRKVTAAATVVASSLAVAPLFDRRVVAMVKAALAEADRHHHVLVGTARDDDVATMYCRPLFGFQPVADKSLVLIRPPRAGHGSGSAGSIAVDGR